MKKLLIVAAGALAVGACDVNVTSNDARTQDALNQAQDLAKDAGNTLSNAASAAGNEVQDLGNRVGNIDVDINTNTARTSEGGNKQ
jgi:hypothetical protein